MSNGHARPMSSAAIGADEEPEPALTRRLDELLGKLPR
jgi:hypothetical protein